MPFRFFRAASYIFAFFIFLKRKFGNRFQMFHVKHFFGLYFFIHCDFFQIVSLWKPLFSWIYLNYEKAFRLCSIVSRETFFRFFIFSSAKGFDIGLYDYNSSSSWNDQRGGRRPPLCIPSHTREIPRDSPKGLRAQDSAVKARNSLSDRSSRDSASCRLKV